MGSGTLAQVLGGRWWDMGSGTPAQIGGRLGSAARDYIVKH